MKKILIAALLAPLAALAQTYPSPTFNSVTLQNPLTPVNGGTGVANSGTITLGGNFSTTGGNPLVLNTTGSTNITLPTSGTLLNSSSGATAGANSNITSLSGLTTPLSVSQGGTGSSTATGSGSAVLATSPTLVTPNLGTPSAVTLTNATGLPVSTGISGLGTGVAAALTNAVTGSGSPVLATSPTLSNAIVGTQSVGNNSTLAASTGFVAAHSPCPSILDFGGNKSGTVDNSSAFTAALSASPTGRVCVYFPAGKYLFSSTINYTFPNNTSSITIVGAGSDVTELTFTLAGFPGIAVNYLGPLNSAHIRDMSITSQNAGGGTAGIYLNQTQTTIANPANTALTDITNVTIRGSDGYEGTNYFSEGVLVNSVSNINFINDFFAGGSSVQGVGVQLGASSTALGVVYNFFGVTFDGYGNGIYYGAYIQGVSVMSSNFLDVNGIVAPGGNLPGLDQLYVGGSQFNCISNGILLQSPMNAVMLIGNFFLVPSNGVGIQLQNYSQFSILGNTFNPAVLPITNATSIVIGPYTASAGIISGNQSYKMTLAVNLQSGSQFVNVQSNSYSGNTTNVLNNGTNNTVGGGSQ
jgi:hypothetical protein